MRVSFRGLWKALVDPLGVSVAAWRPTLVVDGINDRWYRFFHGEAAPAGPQGQAAALVTSGDPGVEEGVHRIMGEVIAVTNTVLTKVWLEIIDESDAALFRIFRVVTVLGSIATWDITLFLPSGYEVVIRTDATLAGEDLFASLTVLRLMTP